MDVEQCLHMMKSLRDAYAQIAARADTPVQDIIHLKHTLTEFELLFLSLQKSMDIMLTKLKMREDATQK